MKYATFIKRLTKNKIVTFITKTGKYTVRIEDKDYFYILEDNEGKTFNFGILYSYNLQGWFNTR